MTAIPRRVLRRSPLYYVIFPLFTFRNFTPNLHSEYRLLEGLGNQIGLALPLQKANLFKQRKLLNPELSNETSKGVTTQMKALDEYFLMVVFTLLLNRVHVFANLCLV